MRRAMLLATTAWLSVIGGSQACAQPAAAGGVVLQDLVVTAQRREERLQEVPASVTSLNAEAIAKAGVRTTEELTIAVPGLVWGRSTVYSQPTIRGVGSRNSGTDEPNVATYLDGVYQPDQAATVFELSNIERIEVLKGPQGTLFGRNATGGAINIITPRPSFTPRGSLSGTYGRYDYKKGQLYLTGPIFQDKIAGSVAAVAYGDNGYIKNIYLNKTQGKASGVAIRPKLLFEPSETLRFELNGLYSKGKSNALLSLYSYQGNNAARAVYTRPVLNPTGIPLSQIIADQPYTTAGAFVPSSKSVVKMIDAHANYDFGWAALNVVLAHGQNDSGYHNTSEVSPLRLTETTFLQSRSYDVTEWTLSSRSGEALSWIAGVQAYESDAALPVSTTSRNTTTGAFTTTSIDQQERTKSAAGFAEVTWQALPRLFLTGGLRYSWDRKTSLRQVLGQAAVLGRASWDRVSPRFVTRYEFSDHFNVYGSYSEGFKAGIFNATDGKPVNPETISAYEVGAKGDIAGRLRFSAAGYHYDYKDLQVSALIFANGLTQNVTQNAGKVKIDGFEANATAVLTRELSLDATVSLIKTKISNFPNAVVLTPIGGATGNRSVSADVNGNQLLRAPKSTFSLGATYKRPLMDGELTLNATAFFSGAYYLELSNRVKQRGYEVVNASVTWRSNQGYYLTVFGQNLTDQVYPVGWLITTPVDGTQAAKPRWFGVTVGYDF